MGDRLRPARPGRRCEARSRRRSARWPERPFGDALEIGSGTGYFSLNLLQLGLIERLVATDISPGMLAELRATAGALGLEVETEATDAERLPFDDGSFDLVFGHAVLHHLPDLGGAFAELHRVLRPGGTLAFCGEPSRYGDLLAAVPKRAAALVAPAVAAAARGVGPNDPIRPATRRARAGAGGRRARVRARPSCGACCGTTGFEERPHTRRGAARERLRLDRAHARGQRGARGGPRRAGASSPSAATSRSSAWTPRCSSRGCRRRCSTTWCSRARKPAWHTARYPNVNA